MFDLFSDLGGILSYLEFESDSWKYSFQNEIFKLEIICDAIQDGSISEWEGDYHKDIENSFEKIVFLTDSILNEYLNVSDESVSNIAIAENPDWFICPKCNDAWESNSLKAMLICPYCNSPLHNPLFSQINKK